jgi:hypothetical protein
MKTGIDAFGTAESEFESAKHENGTRRPPYRRKHARDHKTLKRDLMPSVPPKTSPGAQNMTTGPDDLGTAENVPGSANMKTGPNALDSTDNEFGPAKHEYGIRHPSYRRKRVRERNNIKMEANALGSIRMKMGADALGSIENESGSATHKNGTERPRYCRK